MMKQELKKMLMELQADVDKAIFEKRMDIITKMYKAAFEDINNGVNLDKWNKDVSEAIKEIESLIAKSDNTAGYEKLKNELYYLKYLIAEKT